MPVQCSETVRPSIPTNIAAVVERNYIKAKGGKPDHFLKVEVRRVGRVAGHDTWRCLIWVRLEVTGPRVAHSNYCHLDDMGNIVKMEG